MAIYTTTIRSIVESLTPDSAESIGKRIIKACPLVFDFDYPIWDEKYKTTLETKILRHYFNREIGLETYGLWKFYLETRMNEIMPYYVDYYKTMVTDTDFLTDVDVTDTHKENEQKNETSVFNSTQDTTGDKDETSNSTLEGSTTNNSVTTGEPNNTVTTSDFPQSKITDGNYASKQDYTQQHLDTTVDENGTSKQESTFAGNTTETSNIEVDSKNVSGSERDRGLTMVRKGMSGNRSYQDLIKQWRDILSNIDTMIIDDLSDLFMSVY